jgi:hypothetical protein
MASTIYRLVNTGLAGEPEHIALQTLDNRLILEISDIDKVIDNDIREWDSALDYDRMLKTPNHQFTVHTINGEIILEL